MKYKLFFLFIVALSPSSTLLHAQKEVIEEPLSQQSINEEVSLLEAKPNASRITSVRRAGRFIVIYLLASIVYFVHFWILDDKQRVNKTYLFYVGGIEGVICLLLVVLFYADKLSWTATHLYDYGSVLIIRALHELILFITLLCCGKAKISMKDWGILLMRIQTLIGASFMINYMVELFNHLILAYWIPYNTEEEEAEDSLPQQSIDEEATTLQAQPNASRITSVRRAGRFIVGYLLFSIVLFVENWIWHGKIVMFSLLNVGIGWMICLLLVVFYAQKLSWTATHLYDYGGVLIIRVLVLLILLNTDLLSGELKNALKKDGINNRVLRVLMVTYELIGISFIMLYVVELFDHLILTYWIPYITEEEREANEIAVQLVPESRAIDQ